MLFSELKCCPLCGSKTYTIAEQREYKGKAVKEFGSSEVKSEYTPDKLETVYGSKAYCEKCGEYLGLVNADKVSKVVSEHFKTEA